MSAQITKDELDEAVSIMNDVAEQSYGPGYNRTLRVEGGKKYAKIVMLTENGSPSVFGFIAMVDVTTKNAHFKAGDVLKAATWKAPSTNFARGNIKDKETLNYPWTGVI